MSIETRNINGKEYKVLNNMFFNAETNDIVCRVLAQLHNSQTRCRIFYGDTETGSTWNEEYNITGTIGRSSGSIKIPLMISNSRSMGGPGILEHRIVGIQVTANHFIYKHEKFNVPKMDIRENQLDKYPFAVYANDETHARFKTYKQADNYIKFMKGERLCK